MLVIPGRIAPPLVCLSSCAKGEGPRLFDRFEAIGYFRRLLEDPSVIIVGHNFAYDLAVLAEAAPSLMRLIFAALDAGRIRDTGIREKLYAIAKGELKITKFSLADLAERWLGRKVEKGEDTYRKRYGELIDVPIADWPEAARAYALEDARTTMDVYLAQGEEEIPDEANQVRAAFALHLMECQGVRTDGERIAAMRAERAAERADLQAKLIAAGLAKPDKKKGATRNMKAIRRTVAAAYRSVGQEPPLTDGGEKAKRAGLPTDDEQHTCTDAEAIEEATAFSDDPTLALVSDLVGLEKEDAYLAALEGGVRHPLPVSWNVLVETGRTSCKQKEIDKQKWGTNLQNPPRKGGIRDCVVAREGFVFCSVDYTAAELASLAQVQLYLLGTSALADAINAGKDLHYDMAAELLGITYEEAKARGKAGDPIVKERRQMSKAANFGLPGGLGILALIAYAWTAYRVRIDQGTARALVQGWHRKWPEMKRYFDLVKAWLGPAGEGSITQLYTGRTRGRVYFTQAANSMFQGLTADVAKRALYLLSRACYTEPSSPLFGSRPVLFLHDEIICEIPEDRIGTAGDEQARIMLEAAHELIPDVKSSAEPAAMRRWYKEAETVRNDKGELIPWEPPEKVAA